MKPNRIFVAFMALLALAFLGLAQQKDGKSSAKQKQDSKEKEKQEEPLFKNRVGYKSSKTTKESTTLAFSGVDPYGKVDQEMLAKVPTDENRAKVQAMTQNRPSAGELQAFLQQGGLKQK